MDSVEKLSLSQAHEHAYYIGVAGGLRPSHSYGRPFVSAAPQQSEICVKFSVFHTVFDVKFW